MTRFIEFLESRQLLSITPVLSPVASPQAPAAPPVLAAPMASTLTNVVGSYTGSIKVSGVHTQQVKANITSQASDGTIKGTLASTADPSVNMTLTGKVSAGNLISMTLSGGGSHPAGNINGTGSGNIVVNGSSITLTLSFNFTQPFKATGTLTLTGTAAVTTSIVVTPPASQTAIAGKSKSFALGSFKQTNATGPFTVDVNWGDGSAHTKFTQASAGTITPQSHTFTKATTDAVSLTITDAKGHVSNKAQFNVTVSPAAAAKLVFTRQPVTTIAGKAITPAVTVAIEDAFGNVVTTNTSTVKLTKNTGPAAGTLSGTLAVAAVKGIATFGNVILKIAGNYTLKATDGTLTAATSTGFTIKPAAAAKLVFTRQPAKTPAGKAITPPVTVAIEDAFGNIVTTNTSTVKISRNTGPTGSTLSGTLSVAAVSGIATFSNLILNTPGTYTLKVIDGVLSSATSASFSVV
jgi:hypothetical protein